MTNSDERIDALIDEVAGGLTEGAPAADFTARVLQQIDARQPRLRWRWVWVAAPLAAAAVILIAMQVVRLKSALDTARGGLELVEVPDAPGTKPWINSPSIAQLKPPLDEEPDATGRKPDATGANRNATAGQVASSIDALAPPRLDVTPLEVTPLDARATPTDSIEVEQLETIAPIAVTPLGTDDSQRRF
jgi:hypothetical protein